MLVGESSRVVLLELSCLCGVESSCIGGLNLFHGWLRPDKHCTLD